jgi:sugar phosphate isomerase/epimerase
LYTMAEFRTEYNTPMDRDYHEQIEISPAANIEEPILPISQIGQTVPENDPTGRFKNIVQGVQAAIRGGAGNIQLVMTTPVEQGMGGRPKAYGKEVRQALKEVAMANEMLVTGIEMPTSMSNLSGFDMQRNVVDEEKRQRDLNEVKETIKFAAEVGQGGGVDVLSWEFDRPIHRAKWFEEDKKTQKAFAALKKIDEKKEEIRFVDERSGGIMPVPIRDGINQFRRKKDGKFAPIDPLEKDAKPELWLYDDFAEYSEYLKEHPEEAKKRGISDLSVQGLVKESFLSERRRTAEAQEAYYKDHYQHQKQMQEKFEEWAELKKTNPERLPPEARSKPLGFFEEQAKEAKRLAASFLAGLEEQKKSQQQALQQIERLRPLETFTVNKTQESLAEAGIEAMKIQQQTGPKNLKKDLYVGPELGWPQYYGSHPKEFANMILGAREKMAAQLRQQGYTPSQAAEQARVHIKGVLDTSHLGMWLQNFRPELPWDERVKEFRKWYGEQIDWLAKENKKHDIIGAIQAVDSAGAGHGHLPAGQGILPVKEAVEKMQKDGGFRGFVTSEGHEEEKFGEGRILMKTWQHFNAPISSSYGPGLPIRRWGEVQHNYMGRSYSPMFMIGSYAPSNEFKLWSEVPLE